jgi:polar amino acid transport system substrate-binding protein
MTISQGVFRRSLGGLLALGLLAGIPAKAQTVAVVEAARAALPERIRQEGVLRIATNLTWAPFAYRAENNRPVGIDISLTQLLAAKLGLRPALDDMRFPTIITGISAGRYHIGVNQISMTPERMATVDMVPYFDTASVLLVRRGQPLPDIGNLCGMTFVVTQGSAQLRELTRLSAECTARNAAEIALQVFPNSSDTLLALTNGRGDAFLTAMPQAIYIARVNARVQVVPGIVPNTERFPAGIIMEKGNAELRRAIALALISAIEDGSYQKILDEFGVTDSAVTVDTVRPYAS